VSRIAVQTSITHPFDGDIDMSLVTPYGARELSSDNGSAGDNYTDTVFSDDATIAITAGAPPYTGTFAPEQDLAVFTGVPLSGSYRLRVADDQPEDTGQITSFSIGVCQCLASSGQCEFGLACQNGVDDDGDGLVDCQEAACASSPGCPKPESACGDALDNDGDNLVDCSDPSCAWACTALGSACTGANRIFTYGPTNLPQTLPQIGAAGFPAPIFSASGGSVVAAAVRFNATHTYVADLVLTLSSPAGTQRVLTSANGGLGDNYIDTVFIDSALAVIGTTGYDTAPFTGNYQPEEPFSAWAGQSALGIWQGELTDVETGDGGSFTELSLALCVAP
jgi:subtilisin-like proprotein convertase family protein